MYSVPTRPISPAPLSRPGRLPHGVALGLSVGLSKSPFPWGVVLFLNYFLLIYNTNIIYNDRFVKLLFFLY
jgi:hypothetical protein